MPTKKIIFLLFFSALLWSSCGVIFRAPTSSRKANLGETTPVTQDLKNLPPPKEPIVVAVYQFKDVTGQFKPSENGNNWSTAVTQGATNILIKALEESKWFVPIERENISNLLNERKIIRSTRTQFGNDQELPALLYAGMILEGGIVSYDANIITGGTGLRYFGIGGGNQYRQDRVTVYIRAVSVSNGKILKTVYTSKTLLSQALDGGMFKYVAFKKLLETETGITFNEPSEMAVTQAIEKAVLSLIVEGLDEGLWKLKNEEDETSNTVIQEYKKEKELLPKQDVLGRILENRRGKTSLGFNVGSLLYRGDYSRGISNSFGSFDLGFLHNPYWSSNFTIGYGRFSTENNGYTTPSASFDYSLKYRLLPFDRFTPQIHGGLGISNSSTSNSFSLSNTIFPRLSAGVGGEYLLKKRVGITANFDYNYFLSDNFDGIKQGLYRDAFWRGSLGINFYFGNKTNKPKKNEN
jgi:curli production assembly/transport component CsgG